jgi:Na+-driven multidrug efflux pump
MNTRLLMILSAVFTGSLGLGATFLPQEIIAHFGDNPEVLAVLLVKVAGALYLGFAFLNWMARGNLIGGIYSRPVAMGNFLHFAVVAVVLSKAMMAGSRDLAVVIGLVAYFAFAVWFGAVLFARPFRVEKGKV